MDHPRRGDADAVDGWADALARVIGGDEEPRPDGWLTTIEVAAVWGLSRERATIYLRRLIASGGAEMRKFRRVAGNAGVRRIPHYRVTGGSP